MITITEEEAKVIAALLSLYDAAWDAALHKRGCECAYCVSLEKAGEHEWRVFADLALKVGKKYP